MIAMTRRETHGAPSAFWGSQTQMTGYNELVLAKLKKAVYSEIDVRSVTVSIPFTGGMPMTCLNERIIGVTFFLLSAYTYADGLVIDSAETMTVANMAPLPIELVPPIPDPQRYLRRYEMEFQSNQEEPFYAQIKEFYSAPVTDDMQLGLRQAAAPTPEPAPQQASNLLPLGPSTAPQLSIVELPNTTLTLGAQPQRRLSLTVNDWVFSATARVAVLHSHSTGATLSVRHGF